jgi:hypothetical protein
MFRCRIVRKIPFLTHSYLLLKRLPILERCKAFVFVEALNKAASLQLYITFAFYNKVDIKIGKFSCCTKGIMRWMIIVEAHRLRKAYELICVYGRQGNMFHRSSLSLVTI